jgi:hypothetical protein
MIDTNGSMTNGTNGSMTNGTNGSMTNDQWIDTNDQRSNSSMAVT